MGGVEDQLRGAVVLLELDHRRVGVVALEVEDVAQVGAAPRVDRLVVVTHHGDVLALPGQVTDPQVLRAVGVLVLVDVQVAPALVVVGEHARRRIEQPHGLVEQVVEVERAGGAQARLVGVVRLRGDLLVVAARDSARPARGRADRSSSARSGPGSPAARNSPMPIRSRSRRTSFRVAGLIVRVVDGEARIDTDRRAVAAQHPRAERVERAHGHVARLLADQGQDARAHLRGGLVGERHGQDLPRLDALDADEVSHPMGEHARLARARASEDEQRTVCRRHRARLLRV